MQKATELLKNLAQFTCTGKYYFHPLFKRYRYTDGVRYLAINAECYWLLEFIFGHQSNSKIKQTPFQVWKLVKDGDKVTISIEDGDNNVVKTFKLNYTSFPIEEYTLWMIDGVLLLINEY